MASLSPPPAPLGQTDRGKLAGAWATCAHEAKARFLEHAKKPHLCLVTGRPSIAEATNAINARRVGLTGFSQVAKRRMMCGSGLPAEFAAADKWMLFFVESEDNELRLL